MKLSRLGVAIVSCSIAGQILVSKSHAIQLWGYKYEPDWNETKKQSLENAALVWEAVKDAAQQTKNPVTAAQKSFQDPLWGTSGHDVKTLVGVDIGKVAVTLFMKHDFVKTRLQNEAKVAVFNNQQALKSYQEKQARVEELKNQLKTMTSKTAELDAANTQVEKFAAELAQLEAQTVEAQKANFEAKRLNALGESAKNYFLSKAEAPDDQKVPKSFEELVSYTTNPNEGLVKQNPELYQRFLEVSKKLEDLSTQTTSSELTRDIQDVKKILEARVLEYERIKELISKNQEYKSASSSLAIAQTELQHATTILERTTASLDKASLNLASQPSKFQRRYKVLGKVVLVYTLVDTGWQIYDVFQIGKATEYSPIASWIVKQVLR